MSVNLRPAASMRPSVECENLQRTNSSCVYEEWVSSYFVSENTNSSSNFTTSVLFRGGDNEASRFTFIDNDEATLTRYLHDSAQMTRAIEDAIERFFANRSVDVFVNCTKTNVISPTEEYYNRFLIEMHRSTGLEDLGGPKWQLIICLFLVFLTVYFALWKGIKSAGKVIIQVHFMLLLFNLYYSLSLSIRLCG